MRRLTILLLVLALGCSESKPESQNSVDVGSQADLGQDVQVDSNTAVALTYEVFAARYGVLETIAGKGEIEDKAVNGWLAGFEGGPAIQAELSRPHMAQADSAGNVYIADKDAHAIRMVKPSGEIITVAGTSVAGDGVDTLALGTSVQLSSPNGVWVKADGSVYIYDLGNSKVRKLKDGQLKTLFSFTGPGSGRGIWVSDDEKLAYLSAGTELKKWTPEDGVSVLTDGFVSLGNLHVSQFGELVVADRKGHSAYRIDPVNGEKTLIAGNGTELGGGEGTLAVETGLEELRGIWLVEGGGFLICAHKEGSVWFVDTAGILHKFVSGSADDIHAGDGEPFNAPGVKISEPRAVAMAPNGDILITEHDTGFIRRIRKVSE